MRSIATVSMLTVIAATTLAAAVAPAYALSCHQLWTERNSYYKARGYCFKTERAISYFGNGGCAYDNERDVPLSSAVRARINQIAAQERAYRCPG